MKRLWTMVILGACCMISAQAQEEDVLRPRGKSAAEIAAEGSSARNSASSGLRFSVGGETGINYNMFSQDLERSVAITNSPEDILKSGDGLSRTVAFFIDFPITSGIGIQGKFLADQKKWSNSGKGGLDIVDAATDDFLGTAIIDADYETVANYLGIAALLRFDIGSTGFFITAGPTYQFLIEDIKRDDKLKITPSEGMSDAFFTTNYNIEAGVYDEISRTTNKPEMIMPPIFESQIGTYSTSRLGIEAGLGYKIAVKAPWYLVPQIRYNRQLGTLATETKTFDAWLSETQGVSDLTFKNAQVHSIQATISFVYQF